METNLFTVDSAVECIYPECCVYIIIQDQHSGLAAHSVSRVLVSLTPRAQEGVPCYPQLAIIFQFLHYQFRTFNKVDKIHEWEGRVL